MLKKSLNWLNTHADHSWTLGELMMRGANPKGPKEYFTDHMTRSARLVERSLFIGGAVVMGVAGLLSGGAFVGAGCLIAAKAVGYLAGHFTGLAVEKADHHFTPPAINAHDYFGYTQLARAVNKKDAAAVKRLIDAGADVESSVPSGYGSETVAELAAYSTPEIKKIFEDVAAKKAAAAAPAAVAPAAPVPVVAEAPKPQV